MKKITIVLLTSVCALTVTNSSFGMLTKTSSIHKIVTYKNIRSFHTNSPIYNQKTYSEAKDVNDKAQKILDKANINNELLHKIIEQNEQNNNLLKENNELLRAIFMMKGSTMEFRKNRKNNPHVYPLKEMYEQDLAIYNNICRLRDKYKFDFSTVNERLERC